jgi:hypothetical protein
LREQFKLNTNARLLNSNESFQIIQCLKDKWRITGFWYPLNNQYPDNQPIVALLDNEFEPFKSTLRDRLLRNNIVQLFHLGEDDSLYEINTDTWEPYYGPKGESFWFDKDQTWVIYVSHENSITFAGNYIIGIVKEIFPEYHKNYWSMERSIENGSIKIYQKTKKPFLKTILGKLKSKANP